jgi:hypothetical protein
VKEQNFSWPHPGSKDRHKPSLSSQWSLVQSSIRDFVYNIFFLTYLSLRAKSYNKDAKEILYDASYKAPLTKVVTK